jgi:hypothetical protein
VRLRLGTAFIEHVDDLRPAGEPPATPDWIRANVDSILATIERRYAMATDDQPTAAEFLDMSWLPALVDEIAADGARQRYREELRQPARRRVRGLQEAREGRGWRRHRIGIRPETGELVNTRCRSGLLTASYLYCITPGLCVSHWLARHWLGPLEARWR